MGLRPTNVEERMTIIDSSSPVVAGAQTDQRPATRVAMQEPITSGERIADSAAALVGSWRLIIIVQTILVVIWVVVTSSPGTSSGTLTLNRAA